MKQKLFSEEVLQEAQKHKPEQDEIMPGTWHVIEDEHEYRIQTDEEIEDGKVLWASCTCPHGLSVSRGIARCSHVAAVLKEILG